MTILGALLIPVGVLTALMISCFAMVRYQKKRSSEQYDERQSGARGKAYGFGVLVGVVYYAWLSIFMESTKSTPLLIRDSEFVLVGIMLIMLAVDMYCFFSEALLPFGGNSVTAVSCFSVLAAFKLADIVIYVISHNTQIAEEDDFVIRSMIAMYWVTMAALHLLAYFRDKRGSHEQ